MSIARYFTEMLDPSMKWDDVAEMVRLWDGQFCVKGVMSIDDAKRAMEIGCTGIILSNHGGRQLDGSRAAFDQLAEIVDAVGDRIDVIMDGGVQRGNTCVEGAFAWGQSGRRGALLSFSTRRRWAGRCRTSTRADARGDRARHEADGMPLNRSAFAQELTVPIAS